MICTTSHNSSSPTRPALPLQLTLNSARAVWRREELWEQCTEPRSGVITGLKAAIRTMQWLAGKERGARKLSSLTFAGWLAGWVGHTFHCWHLVASQSRKVAGGPGGEAGGPREACGEKPCSGWQWEQQPWKEGHHQGGGGVEPEREGGAEECLHSFFLPSDCVILQ